MNRPKIALRVVAFSALAAAAALALPAADARKQTNDVLDALAKQPEAQQVAGETLAKAKDALRRAEQMRKSGDNAHGALLEQAALEWASAGELLAKTARSEKQLLELQSQTTELETKVFRAQALIEQTVARRARAEETLRKLEQKPVKP